MRSIFIFFFFLFLLNQISFIFYNYSWFSLLCSTYVIDFYTYFHFIFVDLNYVLVTIYSFIFFSNADIVLFLNDNWFSLYSFFVYRINDNTIISSILDLPILCTALNNDIIYCIYFDTKVIGNNNIFFYVLQNKLFILPGETTLSFFRVYNNNVFPISGITIYSITPIDFQSFLNKIQCFCFEEIIIYNFEILELPVLFYLDTNISYLNTMSINEFCIEYVLLCKKVA
jgi:cytochrome c oxidase assembly protein Cox11